MDEITNLIMNNERLIYSIANYFKNASQNHNEILPHTGQNGHHHKVYKQMLEKSYFIKMKEWLLFKGTEHRLIINIL